MKKLLVKKILQNPLNYNWSIQGLGMLRLYLSDEVRLHVWDSRYTIRNVSVLHTHPWDFESEVIVGAVEQKRYKESETGAPFHFSILKCGEGGCLVSESHRVNLIEFPVESYSEGRSYTQVADEIHESFPVTGTVSIVTRKFREDRDHAKVYWRYGEEWVSAEPRIATCAEIMEITRKSLDLWF